MKKEKKKKWYKIKFLYVGLGNPGLFGFFSAYFGMVQDRSVQCLVGSVSVLDLVTNRIESIFLNLKIKNWYKIGI